MATIYDVARVAGVSTCDRLAGADRTPPGRRRAGRPGAGRGGGARLPAERGGPQPAPRQHDPVGGDHRRHREPVLHRDGPRHRGRRPGRRATGSCCATPTRTSDKEAAYIDVALAEQMAGVVISPSRRRASARSTAARRAASRSSRRPPASSGAEVDSVVVDNELGAAAGDRAPGRRRLPSGSPASPARAGSAPRPSGSAATGRRCARPAIAARARPRPARRLPRGRRLRRHASRCSTRDRAPDALFVANNLMTVGALRVPGRDAGLRVPERHRHRRLRRHPLGRPGPAAAHHRRAADVRAGPDRRAAAAGADLLPRPGAVAGHPAHRAADTGELRAPPRRAGRVLGRRRHRPNSTEPRAAACVERECCRTGCGPPPAEPRGRAPGLSSASRW